MAAQTETTPKKPRDRSELEYGLQMVNRQLPGEPLMDIVVVPGLGTDPLNCWAAESPKSSMSKEKVFNWITSEEGLQGIYEEARILRYAYASAYWGRFAMDNPFSSIVEQLLKSLISERTCASAQGRPIIFIGHSMGGLVVAEALNEANRKLEEYGKILPCVVGCLFFGTPFRGTRAASYASYLSYVPQMVQEFSDELLKLMTKDNEYVLKMGRDLVQLATRTSPNIELCCFCETEPMQTKDKESAEKHIFSRVVSTTVASVANWGVGKVVDPESATLGNSPGILIYSNHRGMVKFPSPTDKNFKVVLSHLTCIVNNAVINARKRHTASNQGSMPAMALCSLRRLLDSGVTLKHENIFESQKKDSWILEDASYKRWEGFHIDRPPCLWVTGPAGIKKTGLSLSVIDRVKTKRVKARESGPIPLLAYFLCDSSREGCSAIELLKSLVLQLIDQNTLLAEYGKYFLKRSEYRENREQESSNPKSPRSRVEASMSVQNLWHCLRDILNDNSLGDVYIIINNIHYLENCQSSNDLINFIYEEVMEIPRIKAKGARRWFFTSALIKNPNNQFKNASKTDQVTVIDLSIDEYALQLQSNIAKYTKDWIDKLAKEKHYRHDQRYMIQDILVENGENEDWIDIQCIRLGALKENSDTETIIKTLGITSASSLSNLVENGWLKIVKEDPSLEHPLKNLLKALLFAQLSPSVQELSILVGIRDIGYMKRLIDKCKPMIQETNDKVVFVNKTVRKYLLSNAGAILDFSETVEDEQVSNSEIRQFHGILAWRCFLYLEQILSAFPANSTLDESAIIEGIGEGGTIQKVAVCFYPLQFWLEHAIKGKGELVQDLAANLDSFWEKESHIRNIWLGWYLRTVMKSNNEIDHTGMTALHVAAIVGYDGLAANLAEGRLKDDGVTTNKDGYTPLHLAIYYNHTKTAEVLLDSYSNDLLNCSESGPGTPLHIAAIKGHVEAMKLLLDSGADPNVSCLEHGPVINSAIRSGNDKVVKQLLEHEKIDLNFNHEDPPLSLSAAMSEETIFRKILEAGKKKWKLEHYSAALVEACYRGNVANVKLLLPNSLLSIPRKPLRPGSQEPPFKDETLERALLLAATEDHWDCVLEVFRKGLACSDIFYLAAVTLRGNQKADETLKKLWEESGPTIHPEVINASLYQATDNEKKETVTWLLDHCKADANATDEKTSKLREKSYKNRPITTFGNALTAAAWDGTLDIVKNLLGHGAHVESLHGCALQLAAKHGHADVVTLLLRRGAEVDKIPEEQEGYQGPVFPEGTALQAACQNGHTEVVKILIEWGANPNLGRGLYANPLIAATRKNLPDILQLLLCSSGIQVNTRGQDGSTPLINASFYMSCKETEILLEKGADINQADSKGDIPLIFAAQRGDAGILRMLCHRKANILYKAPKLGFALTIAAKQGHIECVQVLEEALSPIFCGLNNAVAKGSKFVRDLLASPGDDHDIVDMEAVTGLQQDNCKLRKELEQIHGIKAGWDEMQSRLGQAEAKANKSHGEMQLMATERERDKERLEKAISQYKAAIYGFETLEEENKDLKKAAQDYKARLDMETKRSANLEEMQDKTELKADNLKRELDDLKMKYSDYEDNFKKLQELSEQRLDKINSLENGLAEPRSEADSNSIQLSTKSLFDVTADNKDGGEKPQSKNMLRGLKNGPSSLARSWALRKKVEKPIGEKSGQEESEEEK